MSANYTEWDLQIYNKRTQKPIDDDSGVCNVLTAGSPVEITIYSDDRGTSASNPLTMSNGVIRFYTASTVTSLDLSIYTANGEAAFVQSVGISEHRVDIDVDALNQILVIPFADTDGTEIDTGFTMVGPVLITDCQLIVTTTDSGDTIDVGFDGTSTNDPDGLINGASIANAGYVELNPTHTAGSSADYYGATTVGVLLAVAHTGADTSVTTLGGFVPLKTRIASSETDANVTFTTGSSEFTGKGYIYLHTMKLPV